MCFPLGERIRLFRIRQNMTQRQLAEALGVSAQAVSKWETGVACPDVTLLYDLSRLLSVTTDALLRPEGKQ